MSNRKLALITGGTSGIGLGIANALAQDHDLALGYRNNTNRAKAALELLSNNNSNGKILSYAADLTAFKDAQLLVENVRADFGRTPDVLVPCAGIIRPSTLFVQSNFQEMENLIGTHLMVNMALAQMVLPGMFDRKFGRIVNISSISSNYMVRGRADYATAKAGVEGFTKALALEVAHRGVTVNAVAPGFIKTNMTQHKLDESEERRLRITREIPAGFIGEPEDVAQTVKFLCSDASRFITGQVIVIDGGQSIGRF